MSFLGLNGTADAIARHLQSNTPPSRTNYETMVPYSRMSVIVHHYNSIRRLVEHGGPDQESD